MFYEVLKTIHNPGEYEPALEYAHAVIGSDRVDQLLDEGFDPDYLFSVLRPLSE